MRLWPFKRSNSQEHTEEKKDIEEVRRRQKKVELELRTISIYADRYRGNRR